MNLAAIIGLIVVGWAVFMFNRLTRLRQLGDNAWADIDVQLKRRHDLIPNVVAVVQGHAGYEKSTLEAVVAARGRAVQASQAGPRRAPAKKTPSGARCSASLRSPRRIPNSRRLRASPRCRRR